MGLEALESLCQGAEGQYLLGSRPTSLDAVVLGAVWFLRSFPGAMAACFWVTYRLSARHTRTIHAPDGIALRWPGSARVNPRDIKGTSKLCLCRAVSVPQAAPATVVLLGKLCSAQTRSAVVVLAKLTTGAVFCLR